MNWLILTAIAVAFDVLRIFTDNYISDVYYKGREAAAQKGFSAFAKTVAGLVILALAGFSFDQFEFSSILLVLFAGGLASISEIFYYIVLGIDDSTNYGIFLQMAPVLYLIFGWAFLGENISMVQLVAIFVILTAPVLIIATSRKRSRKVKIRAALITFLCILVSVFSNLVFVQANAGSSDPIILIQEVALFTFGVGLGDIIAVLAMPKWRKRYKFVKKASKNKVLLPLFASFTVGTIKSFAWKMALVLAPATAMASAVSDSIEPIVIFFTGIVLTLIWPKFGREKLNRKSVLVHLIATIIVVIGIVLMQI